MIPCPIGEQHVSPPVSAPLLSLVVPTYNRADLLNDTLVNITEQLKDGLEHKVELIVNDNASTDGTAELLRAWKGKTGLSYSYYIHAQNMGSPAQLFFAPARARCPWHIAFGDDDGFNPGGIAKIVTCLETHQPDFVTINREVRDKDMQTVVIPALNSAPDKAYATFEDLLSDYSLSQLGLWAGQAMRCEPMLAIDQAYYSNTDNVGTSGFAQMLIYMDAFADRSAYYMSDTAVIHRGYNFANVNQTLINSFTHMSVDLVKLLEDYRMRRAPRINLYEDIGGIKSVADYSLSHTRRLSDFIVENLMRAIAYGLHPTEEQIQTLERCRADMRPDLQEALDLALAIEQALSGYEHKARMAAATANGIAAGPLSRPQKVAMITQQQKIEREALMRLSSLRQQTDAWAKAIYADGARAVIEQAAQTKDASLKRAA